MIKCPYCEIEQEINHDDGYGYEEDVLYEQVCGNCDKTFTYRTSITFYYEAYKADCLNGSNHCFKSSITVPIEYTKMRCRDCDESREPTEKEWVTILKNK